MYRILFIEYKNFYGGGQVYLRNLVSSLDPIRFESLVVSSTNPRLAEDLAKRAIRHQSMYLGEIRNSRNPGMLFLNMLWRVLPTMNLVRLIKNERIALVVANDVYSYLSIILAARLTRTPAIMILHTIQYSNNVFTRFLLRGTDSIVAVTRSVFDRAVAIEPQCRKSIKIIQTGIGADANIGEKTRVATFVSACGFQADELIIGTISRLSREKGIHVLLSAAANVVKMRGRVKFVIIGEGSDEFLLKQQARDLGLASAVVFAGYREDVRIILGALDVVVIPSLSEGLPLVLLESMFASKPVVATAVGGMPDVIRDNWNGKTVPPSDAASLAEAIIALVDDSNLRMRLGINARATVELNYSLEHMMKEYHTVFTHVILEASKRNPTKRKRHDPDPAGNDVNR